MWNIDPIQFTPKYRVVQKTRPALVSMKKVAELRKKEPLVVYRTKAVPLRIDGAELNTNPTNSRSRSRTRIIGWLSQARRGPAYVNTKQK